MRGLLLALVAAVGCHGQPDRLCDRVFIAWAFPAHALSDADDVSAAPGLQIDVRLLTELPPGRIAQLTVVGPDGVENAAPPTRVADDGEILFPGVDVPRGSVTFTLQTDDGCRLLETRQTRFVIDELGAPACDLSFSPEPADEPALAPLRVFNRDLDSDPTPGFELEIDVFTQRTDMEVTLLSTDQATGETTSETAAADPDGQVAFALSLPDGEHAVRALCSGGPSDGPLTTSTFDLLVDTKNPDCELLEPSARVDSADDLDGDPQNGVQVLMVGQSGSADAVGAPAAFFAGGLLDGSPINVAGQSTAVVTVDVDADPQDFGFTAFDRAGNHCSDTVSF